MTTKLVARCGIYDQRPEACRSYPLVEFDLPEECTFTFVGSDRRGFCSCNVGACCSAPRENGEPGAPPKVVDPKGLPCKHLTWVEEETTAQTKTAEDPVSVSPGAQLDTDTLLSSVPTQE